jgi:hypothetical protein
MGHQRVSRDLFLTETHSMYTLLIKEILNQNSPHVAALEGGLIQDRVQTAGNTGWLPFGILTEESLQRLLEVQL